MIIGVFGLMIFVLGFFDFMMCCFFGMILGFGVLCYMVIYGFMSGCWFLVVVCYMLVIMYFFLVFLYILLIFVCRMGWYIMWLCVLFVVVVILGYGFVNVIIIGLIFVVVLGGKVSLIVGIVS